MRNMRNKSCGNGSKNCVAFRNVMRNGIAIGNPTWKGIVTKLRNKKINKPNYLNFAENKISTTSCNEKKTAFTSAERSSVSLCSVPVPGRHPSVSGSLRRSGTRSSPPSTPTPGSAILATNLASKVYIRKKIQDCVSCLAQSGRGGVV